MTPINARFGDNATNIPLLTINDVTMRFGGVVALDHISFDVKRGQICGLIGPNGAGKTTLFNCLSRLYRSWQGEIVFNGQCLAGAPIHQLAALSRTSLCSAR
jgi:branched-chain amino acid transport system ATP-binding protein